MAMMNDNSEINGGDINGHDDHIVMLTSLTPRR